MPGAARGFNQVTRFNLCPACGRPDWCVISADRSVAICMRIASDRPTRNGGFLHKHDRGRWPGAPRADGLVAPTDSEPAAPRNAAAPPTAG